MRVWNHWKSNVLAVQNPTQLTYNVVTVLAFGCILVATSDNMITSCQNVVTTFSFQRRYYDQKLTLLQRCVFDVGFPTWYWRCSNVVIIVMSFSWRKLKSVPLSLQFSFSKDIQYCLANLFFDKQNLFCMCQCKTFAQMVDI